MDTVGSDRAQHGFQHLMYEIVIPTAPLAAVRGVAVAVVAMRTAAAIVAMIVAMIVVFTIVVFTIVVVTTPGVITAMRAFETETLAPVPAPRAVVLLAGAPTAAVTVRLVASRHDPVKWQCLACLFLVNSSALASQAPDSSTETGGDPYSVASQEGASQGVDGGGVLGADVCVCCLDVNRENVFRFRKSAWREKNTALSIVYTALASFLYSSRSAVEPHGGARTSAQTHLYRPACVDLHVLTSMCGPPGVDLQEWTCV